MNEVPEITEELRAQAKLQPGGYLYSVDMEYAKDGIDGAIPPQGIVGAYPVDDEGNIIEEFMPNPNYRKLLPQ